jgi:hypothetical protein
MVARIRFKLKPAAHARDHAMKIILVLIGILCLIAAGFYFVLPAGQLPTFFPGYEAAAANVHVKHGIVAAAVGIVLLVAGWWVGRR